MASIEAIDWVLYDMNEWYDTHGMNDGLDKFMVGLIYRWFVLPSYMMFQMVTRQRKASWWFIILLILFTGGLVLHFYQRWYYYYFVRPHEMEGAEGVLCTDDWMGAAWRLYFWLSRPADQLEGDRRKEYWMEVHRMENWVGVGWYWNRRGGKVTEGFWKGWEGTP